MRSPHQREAVVGRAVVRPAGPARVRVRERLLLCGSATRRRMLGERLGPGRRRSLVGVRVDAPGARHVRLVVRRLIVAVAVGVVVDLYGPVVADGRAPGARVRTRCRGRCGARRGARRLRIAVNHRRLAMDLARCGAPVPFVGVIGGGTTLREHRAGRRPDGHRDTEEQSDHDLPSRHSPPTSSSRP